MYPLIISGVVVTGMLILVYKLLSERYELRQRVKRGIVLTNHLRSVIEQCQKHRGTCNAVMNGNDKLLPQMINIQRDIDNLIDSDKSQALSGFPQWQSFTEHWPRLKQHALANKLTPQNIVRQHSLMIDGQLMLMDDVMRVYELHRLMLDSYTRVSEICIDTLRVAETLGYTRAIGSGVCARGQCLTADRILLEFLRISVKTTSERLVSEVNSINNNDLISSLTNSTKAIRQQIDLLLDTVDKKVLQRGPLKIDSHEYFTLSTRAIDEVLKVFSIIIQYASNQQSKMI
jgi:hypothetical protein